MKGRRHPARLFFTVPPKGGSCSDVDTHEKLEELAEQHYERLFRAAMFMAGDEDVAAELVQETFAAATKAIERFKGRSSYYTWLYGILLNKFRGWLRRKGGPGSLDRKAEQLDAGNVGELVIAEEPDAAEKLERKEAARAVRQALDELPPHHRGVLVLRYLEGRPYAEIAEMMDCSIGTVKSRIHYALQKIGKKLRAREEIES